MSCERNKDLRSRKKAKRERERKREREEEQEGMKRPQIYYKTKGVLVFFLSLLCSLWVEVCVKMHFFFQKYLLLGIYILQNIRKLMIQSWTRYMC